MIAWLSWALAVPPGSQGTLSGGPPRIDRPAPQIVNGSPEPGFPSVVSLGVGPIHVCTGSVIAPRVVLSAAHCSGDLPLEAIVQFGSATFGPDIYEPEHSIRLASAVVHPDYVPLENGITNGEYDFAVAVLAEDAPVEAVFFRTEPLGPDDIGKKVRSVGYGIDETGEGSGHKRSAELTVSDFDEQFLISRSSDNEGANICSGDSGGPQYATEADGRLVQWSVHSWADIQCEIVSGSTRTDVAADWILDQVEAVHGSRDLCRVNGRYTDGVCDRYCPVIDPDCLPVVLGDGVVDTSRGCAVPVQSSGLNSFCAPVILFLLQGLSRRRSV
ncbi:MAG: trypsin-like serine protease [Myxococcota bacterium]